MAKENAFKGTTANLAQFGTPKGSDIIIFFDTTLNTLVIKDSSGNRYRLVAAIPGGAITFELIP